MWDYEAAVERCVRVRVWECVRETRERGRNEVGGCHASFRGRGGGGRVCADAHTNTHTRSTATRARTTATGGA